MPPAPKTFQLKISLLGISPMIWRRVLVPSSSTLHKLHGIFQVAMGWDGIHLFQFDIRAVDYGSLNAPSPAHRAQTGRLPTYQDLVDQSSSGFDCPQWPLDQGFLSPAVSQQQFNQIRRQPSNRPNTRFSHSSDMRHELVKL